MGTIQHHAIIATTWNDKVMADVLSWVEASGERLYYAIGTGLMNGYVTIVCVPDGSKEDWTDSARGDARRRAFKEHLATYAYEDGSNPWDWVEVTWGEYGSSILETGSQGAEHAPHGAERGE